MSQASHGTREPLAREDLEILRLESPTVAGHTLKVAVLDPRRQDGAVELDGLRERVASRIEGAPRLRRRLEMRGRRGAAWVDDASFDLCEHVRAAPAAGGDSADDLHLTCARMMEERLDRTRPLWRIDLVGPLDDGGVAVIWKIHHSMADGATTMRLLRDVLWDESAPRADANAAQGHAGPLANAREALDARRPGRLPGTLRRELHRTRFPSPFDGAIGRSRAVSLQSVPLRAVKGAATALVPGATLNDAVLALVAGGLRRWEEGRGGPQGTVRVRVPVSLHHNSESPEAANRDSFFSVGLPLTEADPVERLRRIHDDTALRKRSRDPVVLDTLLRDAGRLAPPLQRLLSRLALHPRVFALNVSNVAGPAEPPSLLGARVRSLYSVAEIRERHGLRMAVISLADELNFGLCADPAIVGELDSLAGGILTEAAGLVALAAQD